MPPRSDGYIPPCIPTRAAKPPVGLDWVHEIKHHGYRLQVRRQGSLVRLFTRHGYDWTDRYPAIAATAGMLRARSFTIDGEAIVALDGSPSTSRGCQSCSERRIATELG
jgi:ATP-dependent DNA ligase